MDYGVLHWSYRDFRQIPEELRTYCVSIVELYLKENFIPFIPRWFFEEMKNLRFICLAGNLITDIPEQISLMFQLEDLDLSQNAIEKLPNAMGMLCNLTRLKLNENKLLCLPREIGFLHKLEILELSKNRLFEIPIELSRCINLKELVLDDNYLLSRIPTKVFTLPQLIYLSSERCNLVLLPFVVNVNSLEHLKLFNNYTVTHYPIVLEKFMQPNYETFNIVERNRVSKSLYVQRVNCEASPHNLIFPIELSKILDRRKTTQLPNTLVELCLRMGHNIKLGESNCLEHWLPMDLYRRLREGPISVCGSVPCSKDIFSECVLGLVKRRKYARMMMFSIVFCSKLCADRWFQYNCDVYDELSWTLV
ncbi:leucine-rich repeat-containing protein 39 [Toxorhynchites rutilus septentrionalis]|uniref:leucine-rich repeat-containing protein 39 n=1 Tax=Toxorhynchites rutilus septentrionalis TaxID=329112 RepID=UPI00247A3904|nr:leucine-rich repeat-containing protein 39 [Toxorhynchites rutilus septentrionalis]